VKKVLIKKLKEHFGSQLELAQVLDISPTLVSYWFTGKRKIPLKYALKIAQMSDDAITFQELLSKEDKCYLKNT
jgi:DNA-binding transcriptional regulator YdaS (Cro superfamily)